MSFMLTTYFPPKTSNTFLFPSSRTMRPRNPTNNIQNLQKNASLKPLIHPSKPYSTKHILITPKAEWITFLKGCFGFRTLKNSFLYPKLFQLEYTTHHNKTERNCDKNHVMKLIRFFLWVAQI